MAVIHSWPAFWMVKVVCSRSMKSESYPADFAMWTISPPGMILMPNAVHTLSCALSLRRLLGPMNWVVGAATVLPDNGSYMAEGAMVEIQKEILGIIGSIVVVCDDSNIGKMRGLRNLKYSEQAWDTTY